MGKSAPDAPDYRGAAMEQSEASEDITRQQTYANRPTQMTPWGTISWDTGSIIDPASGNRVTQWTQNLDLTPESQQALDYQQDITLGRSALANTLLDRAQQEFGAEFDWESIPELSSLEYSPDELRQRAETAAYESATSRLDPMWDERGQAVEIKLRNQGLRPGMEAYDKAMANFERGGTDAYSQAERQAVGTGRQEAAQLFGQQMQGSAFANTLRQQAIAEEMQKRGMSLNEINSILYGQQVQQPNMPGFNTASKSETPQLLQAANMGYNADLNSFNAEQQAMQGLMSGVGGMAMGAGGLGWSPFG